MRDLDVGARVVGSELGRADGRVVGPDLVAGVLRGGQLVIEEGLDAALVERAPELLADLGVAVVCGGVGAANDARNQSATAG